MNMLIPNPGNRHARAGAWLRSLPLCFVTLALACGPAFAAKKASKPVASGPNYQEAVNAAYAKFKDLHEGKNADYIPALAEVDPNIFGIALVTVDGKVYTTGDITSQVSIQSISKVFTMAKVMEEQGPMAIENN